jgi:beta-lactamase regulating signal transducer with metallopeptidase domain
LSRARIGYQRPMTTGTSLFLIAVGAILRYAVTATVSGVSLTTIGLILMIIGAVGLVISLFYMLAWRPRRARVVGDRVVEREPYEGP